MLLPWKQFRPSPTHRIVCQLSFTHRVAERVKGRKGHVSERRAGCISGALIMKEALFLIVPVGILRDILWEDILEMQGGTNRRGLRPLGSFLSIFSQSNGVNCSASTHPCPTCLSWCATAAPAAGVAAAGRG